MRDRWYDSSNPTTVVRGGTWRGMIWVICIVVFVVVLSFALWAFGVFTSPIKGKGDAFKQQQSSENRIGAQARFEDLYQEVQATDTKLTTAKQALKANPDSQIKQTEFTGLINHCLDVVADYNAEARKYLAKDFRAIDLPPEIDTTSPSTDCKP
jgi:hypothetical protein